MLWFRVVYCLASCGFGVGLPGLTTKIKLGRFMAFEPEEGAFSRIEGSIGRRGPMIDVDVALAPDDLNEVQITGGLFGQEALSRKAIIDTGAEKTCITQKVVDLLQLMSTRERLVHTACGRSEKRKFYAITLHIIGGGDAPPAPIDLVVPGLPNILDADVLIGLDVLRHGKLLIDGPNRKFELLLPR